MNRITFTRTPKCATPLQYAAWKQLARRILPGHAGFCEDCTPEYAAEMRLCGLCEHPEVIFDHNGDGKLPTYYQLRKLEQLLYN